MSGFAQASQLNPARNFYPVTLSDTTLLDGLTHGVVCLTAGNLVAQNWSGVNTTFALSPGQSVNINPQRLFATGSTGTYAVLR